jgi:hypothetical protein
MKKDHIRDYATEAFRYFAAKGKPSYRTLKAQYMAEALDNYQREHEKGSGIGKPTEASVIYAEREVEKKMAELLDILAVEKVYYASKPLVREVIEIVYFKDATEPLRKGDISARVCKASLETFTSERGVYAILKAVRLKFAEERGLRI